MMVCLGMGVLNWLLGGCPVLIEFMEDAEYRLVEVTIDHNKGHLRVQRGDVLVEARRLSGRTWGYAILRLNGVEAESP